MVSDFGKIRAWRENLSSRRKRVILCVKILFGIQVSTRLQVFCFIGKGYCQKQDIPDIFLFGYILTNKDLNLNMQFQQEKRFC